MSTFAERAAEMAGLVIPAENIEGVQAYLKRMREMAKPLMAVAIPDDVESAPVFEPGMFELGVFES
jgi:delta 1-pyrroline-5-carboxylate dehydrogenase